MATIIAHAVMTHLDDLVQTLKAQPSAIYQRQTRLAVLQDELVGGRAELAALKTAYSQALAAATLEAYASGAVDGKNQAQRDVQLEAALAKDSRLAAAQGLVAQTEAVIANIESELRLAEAELAFESNQFRAAQTLATIETARIRAMEEN